MQKPTTNNLLDDTRESLILRGIAGSINSLSFPKFKNLNEMLYCFGYKMVSLNQDNDIYEFLAANRDKLQDIKSRYSKEIDNNFNVVNFSPFEKKLMLLENIIQSFLLKHMEDTESLSDQHNTISMRAADVICNHPRIAIAWLPIFLYNGRTYSIGTQKFNDIYKLIEFIHAINNDMAVYSIEYDYVGDPNPNSIYLKYTFLNKEMIGHKPPDEKNTYISPFSV